MPTHAVATRFFSLLMVAAATANAAGQTEPAGSPLSRERQVWKVGVEIHNGDGLSVNGIATAPVPDQWPEQQIKILDRDTTSNVREIRYRKLGDGVRQMIVVVPRLGPSEIARAMVTFEVTRSAIEGPADPGQLRPPARPDRSLRSYLAPSPLIESTHSKIRTLARQITTDKQKGWQQAGAIFDWVRENVTYKESKQLKGALAALRDGDGDCEEMSSLFIALCRASKIPARTVWVPDHCYSEFFLVDAAGQGVWIPCDATRSYPFGSVRETRIILQKGDNIAVPGSRRRLRYAEPTLSFSDSRGRTKPTLKFIRQRVE